MHHSWRCYTGTILLTAGIEYYYEAQYFKNTNTKNWRIEWDTNGGTSWSTFSPQSLYKPPPPPPPPPPYPPLYSSCGMDLRCWQKSSSGSWSNLWQVFGCSSGSAGASCGCSEGCGWSSDNDCDDGGPGAEYSLCSLGSDCQDCGSRVMSGFTTEATTVTTINDRSTFAPTINGHHFNHDFACQVDIAFVAPTDGTYT